MEFFMAMKPPTTTHQEKKWHVVKGKPVSYEPAELKAARQKLMAHLSAHQPELPYEDAVQLVVKWCFPIPLGASHFDGEWKTSRPDTDNLQKLLKDCMTKSGYWKDDALVVSEIVQKFWAKVPGIYIAIEEV